MPSTRKPVRAQLVAATGATLVLLLGTPSLSAQAEPVYPSAGQVDAARAAVGDKAAQVAAVEARLMASNARLAEVQMAAQVANEDYNLARLLVQERTEAARAAGKRAAAAQKTADIASDKQGQFAAMAYMQGGNLGQLEAFLSSKGPQDVLDRAAGIALISDIRSRITQSAEASSVVAGVLRRQAAQAMAQQLAAEQVAESARTAAQAEVDAAAAETASIHEQQSAMIAQLATLRNTSVALERQRQNGLQAEAEARAAASAKAAAQSRAATQARAESKARAAREATRRRDAAAAEAKRQRELAANQPVTSAPDPGPSPVFDAPVPPRGGTGAVIAFAQAQIGEPYQWGAAGPGSWDCSGLTQMAWAQAGVYLSHYTGYQWSETRRVPLSDLRPGDLVFFGDSGPSSHHMGLYVGNDQMIEAPHAGALVRYASIWRSDILPYGGRPY
ncbi:MAG: C40 family peptidase [Cellulomonas sp.]